MSKLNPDNLSRDFMLLNSDFLAKAGIPTWFPSIRADAERKAEAKERRFRHDKERNLQATCRSLLIHRGYVELTADNAMDRAGDASVRGWFGHLAKPKGNPLMPDLFIFDARQGKSIMVELKTHNVWQPGQKEMCDAGCWKLATGWEEFVRVLEDWESSKGE